MLQPRARQDFDQISVLEGNPDGHRLGYASRLVQEALDRGYNANLATTNRAQLSSEYREYFINATNLQDRPGYTVTAIEKESIGVCAPSLLALTAALKGKQSLLIIPDGDVWLTSLASLPFVKNRISLLLMRTVPSAGGRSRAKYASKLALAAAIDKMPNRRVLRLSTPSQCGESKIPILAKCLKSVEDVLPRKLKVNAKEAHRAWNFQAESGGPAVLVAGSIDERKSVEHLVNWIRNSTLSPPPRLILTGKQTTSVRSMLSTSLPVELRQQGRLVVEDRFVTETELATRYVGADAVMILHENEGPSGALAYAMQYERPVIAWGARQVTAAVERARIGIVIENRDVASLDFAMRAITNNNMTNNEHANCRGTVSFLEPFLL